jgi:hypothetical protein
LCCSLRYCSFILCFFHIAIAAMYQSHLHCFALLPLCKLMYVTV